MHSTLKLRESDPHDLFAIEPEVMPVAWADKVLADIQRDALERVAPQEDGRAGKPDPDPEQPEDALDVANRPALARKPELALLLERGGQREAERRRKRERATVAHALRPFRP